MLCFAFFLSFDVHAVSLGGYWLIILLEEYCLMWWWLFVVFFMCSSIVCCLFLLGECWLSVVPCCVLNMSCLLCVCSLSFDVCFVLFDGYWLFILFQTIMLVVVLVVCCVFLSVVCCLFLCWMGIGCVSCV